MIFQIIQYQCESVSISGWKTHSPRAEGDIFEIQIEIAISAAGIAPSARDIFQSTTFIHPGNSFF
jgi:hypothetical protein